MTSWRKIYVVRDDKNKSAHSATPPISPPPEKPKKRRRAWKYWLFFSFLCMLGGLYVGLNEDQEWECLIDGLQVNIATQLNTGSPSQHIWKRAIERYELRYSDHFVCRMECREITRSEVWTSLKNGVATDEFVNDGEAYSGQRGEIKYTVRGETPAKRPIKTVFAVNTQSRRVTFITVMDTGIEKRNDPCGTNICKSRP